METSENKLQNDKSFVNNRLIFPPPLPLHLLPIHLLHLMHIIQLLAQLSVLLGHKSLVLLGVDDAKVGFFVAGGLPAAVFGEAEMNEQFAGDGQVAVAPVTGYGRVAI